MRFLTLLLCVASAFAQPNLFLLPNASSQTPAITQIRIDPFSLIATFPAQPGASFFFVNADGTKYYSVARAATDTVLVLSAATPSTVLKRHNLSSAEAAAITPDRRRLLVVASGLHIIDTATDNILSTITDVGSQPMDVAVALDASRAFVLSPTSNRLTAVDLTTNSTVGNPITIPGTSSGVAVGPNGLVYVTAANRLYEIDGRFMTIRSEIPLNARPGKIVFTPDGRYGMMVNQTPGTGSSIILIDLPNRTIAGTIPNFQVILDTLIVASNSRVYAVSNQRQALYEISVNPLNINSPEIYLTGNPNFVFGATASSEWPNPRYLFVGTLSSLLRLDNSAFPPTGSGAVAMPSGIASLVFAAPAATGAPTQITGYNSTQTTAPGTAYLPLVARVFNASGQPLQGATVTFSSDDPSAQIQPATVTTNAEGYALSTVTAPNNPAAFTVTATAGAGPTAPRVTYNLNTGGTSTDTLTILGGQGQLVAEQFQIREPLVVQLRDAQGQPAANRTITFSIRTGTGTLNGGSCVGNICAVQTDVDGRARIGFIATSVFPGTSYGQQTISATNGYRTISFIVTTYAGQLAGGGSASPPVVQRLAPLGNILTGAAGSTLTDAIRIRVVVVSGPQAGQGIPNLSLRASTLNQPGTGPTAECSGDAFTDLSGVATCNLVFGSTIGSSPLNVSIGGVLNLGGPSLSIDVRAGPPNVTVAFPFSSQGTTTNLTFGVSHPDGLARLGIINLLINSSLDARNACYLAYSVPQRVLYLVNDGGPTGGLSPGLLIGSPNTGSIANTQCRIFAEGSSAVANGNILTLTFNASFTESFAGSKIVYLAARTTDELTQGWAAYGVHEIPIPNPTFPNSSPLNPGSGVIANSIVTFTYRDATNSANLQTLWGLTNTSLDARNACYFAYHAPSNLLFLIPDSGDASQAAIISLVGSSVIENSQCRISAVNSAVSRIGNTLTLALNITYKSAFAGPKIIWTAASTLSNAISPWKASGAWRVPAQ